MGLFDFLKKTEKELKRNEIKRLNFKSSHNFKGFKQLFIKAKYDLYENGQKQLMHKYSQYSGKTLPDLPISLIVNDNGKNSMFIELVVDELFQGIIWQDSAFFDDILNGNVEKVAVFLEDKELKYYIKLK